MLKSCEKSNQQFLCIRIVYSNVKLTKLQQQNLKITQFKK